MSGIEVEWPQMLADVDLLLAAARFAPYASGQRAWNGDPPRPDSADLNDAMIRLGDLGIRNPVDFLHSQVGVGLSVEPETVALMLLAGLTVAEVETVYASSEPPDPATYRAMVALRGIRLTGQTAAD